MYIHWDFLAHRFNRMLFNHVSIRHASFLAIYFLSCFALSKLSYLRAASSRTCATAALDDGEILNLIYVRGVYLHILRRCIFGGVMRDSILEHY